jgi:uncharacterized membrane protein YGL010W
MALLEEEFRLYLRDHQDPRNRATHYVGIPLIVITPVVALILLDWRIFVAGQVVGWAFQLVGHKLEGNKPSFTERPISLLMGPLMVMVELCELVGIHFGFAQRARQARQN